MARSYRVGWYWRPFRYNCGPFLQCLPDMIVLEGQPALSPFRLARLQARLQQFPSSPRVLGAWHVYWIDREPGAQPDAQALTRILQAGTGAAPRAEGAASRYVAPRLGTISPGRARPASCCAARAWR